MTIGCQRNGHLLKLKLGRSTTHGLTIKNHLLNQLIEEGEVDPE